jgi:NADP-dependent 3-hydroxy acid dehydrogenase YdfG
LSIIITSAPCSIGLATALEFKEQGAEVIIIDNDQIAIERVQSKYNIAGYYCDLTNIKNIESVFNKIS